MSITHPSEQAPQQPDPNEWSAASFNTPLVDPMRDTGEIAGLPIVGHQNQTVPTTSSQEIWTPPPVNYRPSPQLPESYPAAPQDSSHRTRNRLLGAFTAVAVLAGGGVVAGELLAGNSKAKNGGGTVANTDPTANGKPSASPTPNALSPTSIPKTKEAPVPGNNTEGVIDLTTVQPGLDTELNVGGASVPEYIKDPSLDPLAALNATLADYSYYLSRGLNPNDEAEAHTATLALTTDASTTTALASLRELWQTNHPDQVLWFWSDPLSPTKITQSVSGNDITIAAKGTIYYNAFPKSADGSWIAPPELTTTGAKHMQGIELTFTYWNRNTNQGTRGNLIGSQVTGVPNQGSKLVLPFIG